LAIKILDGEVLNGDHVVANADLTKREVTFNVSHRVGEKVTA
jgi:hypothetical protein